VALNAGIDGDAGRQKSGSISRGFLGCGGPAATLARVDRSGLVSGDWCDAASDRWCPGDSFSRT
jgi:hypothetical protein